MASRMNKQAGRGHGPNYGKPHGTALIFSAKQRRAAERARRLAIALCEKENHENGKD